MKIHALRWWIVVLVFLAAVLNYVDRQTLSALAPTIQADLRLNDRDYANIVNIFLIAYTFAYLISGKLVDRLGTRKGTAVFVIWWSLANFFTAWSQGFRSLGAFRLLLGLGEAGIWPAASKAVSEWFPARERALAIGFYTMGATIGAMLTPKIVIPLASHGISSNQLWMPHVLGDHSGWRIAFLVTGAAGFLWLIPWLLIYRKPRESKLISKEELEIVNDGRLTPTDPLILPWTWKKVLTFPPLWFLLAGRLLTDPVWYFYQFWFAKFLHTEHAISQEHLTLTWVIYAAAGIGSLMGGWLSGRMVRHGTSPAKARLWVMLGCACLMPVSPLITMATGLPMAVTISACTVFASLAWLTNISALVVDVVPKHSLGTVFSVVAAGSTAGSVLMNTLIAAMISGESTSPAGFLDRGFHLLLGPFIDLVEGKGYGPWFFIMAFLHPIAFLILWLGGIHRPRPAV